MANITRTYIIPLRKEFQKSPKYRRAKKAVNAVKGFMQKHMKTETVLIGPKLNLKIWEHGMKNPPGKVKVTAVKDDKEDSVRVELFGFDFNKKEKKKKQEKPKGIAGKLQDKLVPKEKEAPKTPVTTKKDIKEKKVTAAQKEEAPKVEEKTEVPAEKKEEPKATPTEAPAKTE
ncbi:MAG: 50S ribosomal protein L31e [Candidatus Woesearchaeota archaeon]